MGLNDVVSAERTHIGFFGMRNAGKSSVVNAVTGQELSVVSDVKGTTTDPVKKAMELLPIGPVVIIDTPGLDDTGELGELRVKKTKEILNQIDIAVLIVDATIGLKPMDEELLGLLKERNIPCLTVFNKTDLLDESVKTDTPEIAQPDDLPSGPVTHNSADLAENAALPDNPGDPKTTKVVETTGVVKNSDDGSDSTEEKLESVEKTDVKQNSIYVSALTGEGIHELKERIGDFARQNRKQVRFLVKDLLKEGDLVLLVIPVDESAPKGRLILPQQQVMRELLDYHYSFVTCQDTDLKKTLSKLAEQPALVITDSQAFERVAADTPKDIPLTSFSILMARYKGGLQQQILGARRLSGLKDGDTVLISEGCTHHRQCKDIGTVKMPGWIEQYTGKKLNYRFTSGGDYPESLDGIALVVHCGGCMLNENQMKSRVQSTVKSGVPIVNYGVAIACMHGILKRALQPVPGFDL